MFIQEKMKEIYLYFRLRKTREMGKWEKSYRASGACHRPLERGMDLLASECFGLFFSHSQEGPYLSPQVDWWSIEALIYS